MLVSLVFSITCLSISSTS